MDGQQTRVIKNESREFLETMYESKKVSNRDSKMSCGYGLNGCINGIMYRFSPISSASVCLYAIYA